MNRLVNAASGWWSGRTSRERHMIMVMAGLLAATVVWLGVVRPVLDWRIKAADRAEAAATTLAAVRAAIAGLEPARPAGDVPLEGLEPLIRRSADGAGLDVVTVMTSSGQLGFQLSSVGSGPLFAWLTALEKDHRLSICSLGVTENADATLNVEGAIASGRCTG